MKTAIVLLSGGLDSATLLAFLLREGFRCVTVSFNYGQRHNRELEYAHKLAIYYGVANAIVDLQTVGFEMSCLTELNKSVPNGHYADPTMKATVVPNRNAIMLSIAYAKAIDSGADIVAFAAHAGDAFIYPDCRKDFILRLSSALQVGNESPIEIASPFIEMTKQDIAALAHRIGVPIDLTWSCYKGQMIHCGTCGTCYERQEAFEFAGIQDPTQYVRRRHDAIL